MGTLTEQDLRSLLAEAADGYPVPEDGPVEVLDAIVEESAVVPLLRRRPVQLSAAAAVAAVGLALGLGLFAGNADDRVGQLAGAARPPVPAGGDEQRAEPVPEAPDVARQRSGSAAGPEGRALHGALQPEDGSAAATKLTGAAREVAAAPGQAAAPGRAPAPAAPVAADGSRILRTGAVALVVEDGRVTAVLTEVRRLAGAAGGDIAATKTQESGPTPSGSVTLRVPVEQFESLVEQVRSLDAQVRSATTSGQDITAQYADVEAQIRTLRAARERFLDILSRARSIGDVLAVQQRVDDVTGKIDQLEGQRRVLADQSELATLEVSVTEADDPLVKGAQPDTGLSKAFADAWHGFTTGVEALIRLSGRAILLVLCLAVAVVAVRLGWRIWRRRLV
ncbi:MAG: DUF4349 domain-containing protein [Mycobacteriales bacterium]